jgi:predicted O-linked N-acetylglucosamine transferase (SPINDLY family)
MMSEQDKKFIETYLCQKSYLAQNRKEDGKFRNAVGRLDFATLLGVAENLGAQGGTSQDQVVLYRTWLDLNGSKPGPVYAAWFNLGVQMAAMQDYDNAATCYRNALALKPDFYMAAINLGLTLESQGKLLEALECWDKAVQPVEARTSLLNHQGRLMEDRKLFGPAHLKLFTSLLTDPTQPDVIQHWVHLRQKMCEWPVYATVIPDLPLKTMKRFTGALSALALTDDITEQSDLVKDFLDRKFPPSMPHLSPAGGYGHKKIRLGYLSSDYCMHPVSYLTAELFESHNRDQFEVYGYCSTRDDGSPVRARVLSAFDKYTLVRDMTDEQLAHTIRQDEIDILIDLNGITQGTRLAALRWRPAPVQLTYLGYIGAIPMPELDYMIADEFVIPPERAHLYHPKPLYLPGSYQVNDSKLPVGEPVTRAQVGLPEDKFVFCCFSNNYKITEEIFGAWLQILKQTDQSVLWVMADNEWSRANMVARVAAAGIDLQRLIFAGRVDPPQYLSQLRCADLFLDTFPYNAGTTASDALRMGLPIVTYSGDSFVGRMAGSLLHAIGMDRGITHSIPDYVARAVEFAQNPDLYRDYRSALDQGGWEKALGDITRVTTNMESLYRSIAVGCGA